MRTLFNRIFVHWKSTTQSGLTAIIGLSAVAPSIYWLTPKQAASLVSAGVVGKVFLGMLQQDAGTVVAKLPDGETKAMPGHEIPDDKAATAVKQ
jgi:hypothetical protein